MKKFTRRFFAIVAAVVMFVLSVGQANAEPLPGGGSATINTSDCVATVKVSGVPATVVVEAITYTSNGETQVDDIVGLNPTLTVKAPSGVTSDIHVEVVKDDHVIWSGETRISCEVNVYTTPGEHYVNGREWRTSCEKYSITTRCRTEIKSGGQYVFNNLTYLSSPRSAWANNLLGGKGIIAFSGEWLSADRQWRTECDTSATGRGGCRAYILSWNGQEWTWVFNNIVLFR